MVKFYRLTIFFGARDCDAIFRCVFTRRLVLRLDDNSFYARAQDFSLVERMGTVCDIFIVVRYSMSPSESPGANAVGERRVFNLAVRITGRCVGASIDSFAFVEDLRDDVILCREAIYLRRVIFFRVFVVFYVRVFCIVGIRDYRGLFLYILFCVLMLFFFREEERRYRRRYCSGGRCQDVSSDVAVAVDVRGIQCFDY